MCIPTFLMKQKAIKIQLNLVNSNIMRPLQNFQLSEIRLKRSKELSKIDN